MWSGWRREKYIRYFFFFLIWRCLVRRQKTFLIRRKRTWASFLSNIKKKLLLHVLSQILMMRSHDLQIFLREPRNGNVKLITEVWNPIHRVDTGKWSENCKSHVESVKNLTGQILAASSNLLVCKKYKTKKNEIENTKCKVQNTKCKCKVQNTKCISYHIHNAMARQHVATLFMQEIEQKHWKFSHHPPSSIISFSHEYLGVFIWKLSARYKQCNDHSQIPFLWSLRYAQWEPF